ncbi:MAG: DNA/RNA nuclease SfsA, partial [Myxococcota bacterium]
SVTARGTRHLGELMDMVAAGHRAVLLFVCNRSGARAIRPADEVDPLYGYTLRRARAAGVEILAYRSRLSPDAMVLDRPIPLELPALDYIPPPPRPRRQAARRRGGKKTAVM